MSSIAIIPARGGSKRIPRKNIKDFCGKPIIAYSIQTALESGLFDKVMVSTDDEEIAEIATTFGAEVPFFRSEENAGDFATTLSVIKEVIGTYEAKGVHFRYACCLYPTAPFVTPALLKKACDMLVPGAFETVLPVVKYSYPIWRSLKLEGDSLSMWWPENANARSQDLPVSYHDAGQFYFVKVAKLAGMSSLLTSDAAGIPVSEMQVQDIDTADDWKIAELKFRSLYNPSSK